MGALQGGGSAAGAAGGTASGGPSALQKLWECHQCTLLNDPYVSHCIACEAPRLLLQEEGSLQQQGSVTPEEGEEVEEEASREQPQLCVRY